MEKNPRVVRRFVSVLLSVYIASSQFYHVQAQSHTSVSIIPDGSMTVSNGGSVSIHCTSIGDTQAAVTADWTTTATGTTDLSNRELATPGTTVVATLNLMNIDSGYCGEYTCTILETGFTSPITASTSIYVVPIIETSPDDSTAILPSDDTVVNVTFSCTVNGGMGSMINITWDGPATAMANVMNSINNMDNGDGTFTSNLVLSRVTGDSTGEYRCSAFYLNPLCNMESVSSDPATLTVIELPVFIEQLPGVMIVDSGTNVTITCSISALTEHTNSSFETPEEVSSSSAMVSMSTNSTFISYSITFPSVDYTVGGVYTCSASNLAGAITNSTLLYIRPTITPPSVETNINEMRFLECEVQEFPEPTYRWRKMDDEDDGMLFELFSGSGGSGMNVFAQRVLVLDPVMFGDEGSYLCEVDTDETGRLMSDVAIVTVSPNSSVEVTPRPIVIRNRKDNVRFTCSALGGPNNTFQWMQDGEVLIDETTDMLFLTSVNATDGGDYTCVVSNTAGNDSSMSTLYIRPYLITQPETEILAIAREQNVSFICEAEGFPSPSITWERVEANTSLNTVVANGTILAFMPVDFGDEGDYQCLAQSTISSEMNVTMLTLGSDFVSTLYVSPVGSVTVSPNVSISSLGDNVTLNCLTLGGPDNTFQWTKDGEILDNEMDPMLVLTNINASSGGEYICTVSNLAGNESASSTLYVRPYIINVPAQIDTTAGTRVTFTCEADGFPPPSISWTRVDDGEQVANTSNYSIPTVDYGNEGRYRCDAVSMLPDGTTLNTTGDPPSILYVSPQGSVVINPRNLISNRGDNVTFICTAEGGPDNTFQVSKDGSILVNDSVAVVVLTDIDASDGGEYRCTVSNPAGSGFATLVLNIRPYFTTFPQSELLADINDNVNFTCEAEGFPTPSISWVNLNSSLAEIEQVSNISVLEFNPVRFGDEGNYQCSASATSMTPIGMDLSEVFQPHSVLVVSPIGSVSVMPESPVAMNGSNVTFTCLAEGGPNNTFQWMKDGDILASETEETLTLTTIAATDGGDYRCTVSNRAGNDSSSSTLNVHPYIITQPEVDIRVTDQTNVSLSCEAESFPPSHLCLGETELLKWPV